LGDNAASWVTVVLGHNTRRTPLQVSALNHAPRDDSSRASL